MIDSGRDAYAAAAREMREETGLAPERFFKTDYRRDASTASCTDAVHLVPAFAGLRR